MSAPDLNWKVGLREAAKGPGRLRLAEIRPRSSERRRERSQAHPGKVLPSRRTARTRQFAPTVSWGKARQRQQLTCTQDCQTRPRSSSARWPSGSVLLRPWEGSEQPGSCRFPHLALTWRSCLAGAGHLDLLRAPRPAGTAGGPGTGCTRGVACEQGALHRVPQARHPQRAQNRRPRAGHPPESASPSRCCPGVRVGRVAGGSAFGLGLGRARSLFTSQAAHRPPREPAALRRISRATGPQAAS